ncbi:MAG TPA: GNAT family N-acetyltransferase [Solirubrobacteraceae bacterium]|nr:GNAT family N-acetyltransferase [Solirubrobacteraceae bacterium]
MPPAIRPAEPRDAEALAAIWRDAAAHFVAVDGDAFRVPDEEGLAEWLGSLVPDPDDPREALLVAEQDGRVVGLVGARLLEPEPTAHRQMLRELAVRRVAIDSLSVVALERGRGVGTALLDAAEEWARSRGAEVAVVDANWASGVAVGYYEERAGYARRGLNLRKPLAR